MGRRMVTIGEDGNHGEKDGGHGEEDGDHTGGW